jgi:hypothetical protein
MRGRKITPPNRALHVDPLRTTQFDGITGTRSQTARVQCSSSVLVKPSLSVAIFVHRQLSAFHYRSGNLLTFKLLVVRDRTSVASDECSETGFETLVYHLLKLPT